MIPMFPNPKTVDKKYWPSFAFGRREYPIKQQYHGDAIVLPKGFCEVRIIITTSPLLGVNFFLYGLMSNTQVKDYSD